MDTINEDGNADFKGPVRLAILEALHKQSDYRLSDTMISSVLAAYAMQRSRDFVIAQMKWLESEVGAIKLRVVGETYIAELTETGEDHVERRRILHGIKKPFPARS